MKTHRGFTLIELMIVIGIVAVVMGAGALFLGNFNATGHGSSTANQIATLIRTAQKNAMSREMGTRWGVIVNNTTGNPATYGMFSVDEILAASTTYIGVPGTVTDQGSIPPSVTVIDPALGTSTLIFFTKNTGLPTASSSITLQTRVGSTTQYRITVDANGRIDLP